MRRTALLAPVALSLLALAGCSADAGSSPDPGTSEHDFSSNQATLLDFEFDAELSTDSSFDDKQTIQDQLLYTIGHLNADNSVGRLDNLVLTNVKRTQAAGKLTISYHAKLPVAWGSKTRLPTTYELMLPKDVSFGGISAFTEAHKHSCVDFGAHEVDTGSMWYYFRPHRSGCDIKPTEVVTVVAQATKSAQNTTAKYPEYHKVWEDNRLEIVAIFGKYEANAVSGDAGIDGYNEYLATMKRELLAITPTVTTMPENLASNPGPGVADVTFEATLADGKVVKITALLVDAITQVPPGFDARYESLTPTADIIAYNGHAGLGQNVRALARKGRWVAGKYQMFFMNGCDTFAYVDGSLAQTRAALNADDPTGTKYMEFVTNAMPSFFSSMPDASSALMKGLLAYQTPKTYDQIFANIDRSEVVLVTGEEDNVFQPGMPIGTPGGGGGGGGGAAFTPFEESGTLARGIEKSSSFDVPAGSYVVELSGDGDADLYVKKGTAPTQRSYDCRPYANGSKEKCTVTFQEAGKLNVMVRGYAASSSYTVKGSKQ
ncbi:MAG TPA: PPC domain-containing protein [Labilithrix sp.]|nr:PPC domain-containing protein [Labilithrix sp.]